jgi:hypothetical protein
VTAYTNAGEDDAHIFCAAWYGFHCCSIADSLEAGQPGPTKKMWVASRMSRDTKFLGHPDDLGLE